MQKQKTNKNSIILIFSIWLIGILDSCNWNCKNEQNQIMAFDSTQIKYQDPDWVDSTFTKVYLPKKLNEKKVIKIDNQIETVYLTYTGLKKDIQDIYDRELASKLNKILDSCNALKEDTIELNYDDLIDYALAVEFKLGKAMVFYKKTNSFIHVIYHRREDHGIMGMRYFYYPDKETLLMYLEALLYVQPEAIDFDTNE